VSKHSSRSHLVPFRTVAVHPWILFQMCR